VRLCDLFTPETVRLDLASTTAQAVLADLVSLLRLDQQASDTLLRILRRREELGSTGVGRGIAIPHGRSLVVGTVRLAYGRCPAGIPYGAIDGRPVNHFFLIVAPPVEASNQYLPVLGRIAQFGKDPDVPERLNQLQTVEEFFALLEERGA
jgi:mannitol/fructose-specific phosphotransferase system IIA component (Ntr-type)